MGLLTHNEQEHHFATMFRLKDFFLDHDINQTVFQNWSFSPSWAWTTHLKASLKPPASKLWEKQESHLQILPSMRIVLFHIVGETHALGNFSTWFFCWFPLP